MTGPGSLRGLPCAVIELGRFAQWMTLHGSVFQFAGLAYRGETAQTVPPILSDPPQHPN